MAVAFGFGIFLVIWGNVSDHRLELRAHIAAGIVAALAVLPYAWRLAARTGRERAFGRGAIAATALVFLLPFGVSQYLKIRPNPADRIVNPMTAPLVDGGRGWRADVAVLPLVGEDERRRHHPVELLHGLGDVRRVPQGHLRAVEELGPPLRVVQ